jgi:hypothetical protein
MRLIAIDSIPSFSHPLEGHIERVLCKFHSCAESSQQVGCPSHLPCLFRASQWMMLM